jgi:hypothetical protein
MRASLRRDALGIFALEVTSGKDHKYMTYRGKSRNQPMAGGEKAE